MGTLSSAISLVEAGGKENRTKERPTRHILHLLAVNLWLTKKLIVRTLNWPDWRAPAEVRLMRTLEKVMASTGKPSSAHHPVIKASQYKTNCGEFLCDESS